MVRKVFPEEIIFLRKLGMYHSEIASMTPVSKVTIDGICAQAVREGILASRKGISYAVDGTRKYFKKLREEKLKKIREILKANGPTEMNKLASLLGTRSWAVGQVAQKNPGLFLKIEFSLKRQPGGYRYKTHEKIFTRGFSARKNFVALRNERTALVRFFIKVLRKPESSALQGIQTRFLKRYLTEAERIAVQWALGVRKWRSSQVSRSVQVDGVVMPTFRRNKQERRGWEKKLFKKRKQNAFLNP